MSGTALQTSPRAVLVTGGTSGIGQATVRRLSQANYAVFASYRKDEDREALAALPSVTPVKLDVTVASDIDAAAESIERACPAGLYALINNAGITYTAPFEYADERKARRVMDVNVWAPFATTQRLLPSLKRFSASHDVGARVINVASWAGIVAQPFNGAYNASKFAILGLTESMHYDLGLVGVHAVAASPGVTKTPLLDATTSAGVKALEEMPPEGRAFYRSYMEHLTSMSESSSDSSWLLTAEAVAEKLVGIVETKKPSFKYNLAIDAKLMESFMRKYVPFGWRERMFKKMYHLD